MAEGKLKGPVFTVQLTPNVIHLREGDSARFEARLEPTDDPKLKVDWFYNGKPMMTGSRFRTFSDFGFILLEISPVETDDSGQYTCRVTNEYGVAVSASTMRVTGDKNVVEESQVSKGTIDKLARLEGCGYEREQSHEEEVPNPPQFLTTPSDLTQAEGGMARFECRVTPTTDPSLIVEWYHNGQVLSVGSRIKTISDFGCVILTLTDLFTRDSGVYTCKASNKYGFASTSCKLQVLGRQGVDVEPQVSSAATNTIRKLEEALYRKDEEVPENEERDPPVFITQLQDNLNVAEGGRVHLECRVEPRTDPTMRIDWFFNGRPFNTGSRVTTMNEFGYIALDIDGVYARDSGEYICRATNKWGTAMSKAKLVCLAKNDNIVTDSMLPDLMTAEKLKELENKQATGLRQEDYIPQEPPRFITEIESMIVKELEPVRFETRVEPKEDPRLKVEWFRNGVALPYGSRFHPRYDLGFVALDIDYVYPEDQGLYVCRAYNSHGEAFTKATISCDASQVKPPLSEGACAMLRSLIQKDTIIKK
uniref:Titin n=1 Tax=Cacopsylla melanoneura TaxID=428564 RepID=A0A8D8Q957_9HEMI